MMLTLRGQLSGWRPLAWAFASVLGLAASAGSLSLENSVVPAGGGSGRAGRFSLDGSIGQPVAESAASIGGSSAFAERAGFWSQVVRWINADPVARLDVVERRTGQGTHVLIRTLLANDSGTDLELLSFNSFDLTTAAGGSVFREGPWLNYQPPASGADPSEDSFTYVARDALGRLTSGTVRIQIAGIVAGGAPYAVEVILVAGIPPRISVHFIGIAGRRYQVETSGDVSGPWINSGVLIASGDGSMVYSEVDSGEPRFFRIRETP
jgi:hypothetical protein